VTSTPANPLEATIVGVLALLDLVLDIPNSNVFLQSLSGHVLVINATTVVPPQVFASHFMTASAGIYATTYVNQSLTESLEFRNGCINPIPYLDIIPFSAWFQSELFNAGIPYAINCTMFDRNSKLFSVNAQTVSAIGLNFTTRFLSVIGEDISVTMHDPIHWENARFFGKILSLCLQMNS